MRHLPPQMFQLCCALGVALMLAACSDTKYRTATAAGGADPAAVAEAEARAEAAEAALEELRASLATAQEALTPGTTAQQREQAREAVVAARADLAQVREMLTEQPASAARDAADGALAAVDTALAETAAALQALAGVGTAGLLQLASMHTSLDRAQTALDTAQAQLKVALAANPSPALRTLLAQAQVTLTAAQVSLVPVLRAELASARADAEAERQRADTYDPRVSLADALVPREERFVPRGAAQITRTARTDTGEEGWERLEIASDGVAWATGKAVGSAAGGLRATDELPLRAVTLRAAGRHPIRIQGRDGTPAAYSNSDGVVTSSLRITDAGVTLKWGGAGVIYYDNQRRFDLGANQDSWAGIGPDGKLGDHNADTGATMTPGHAADLGLAAASGSLTAAQATMLVGYALDNPSRFGADRKQGDASATDGSAMTVAHAADLGLDEPSGNLDAAQAALLVGYAEDNPATPGCWQQDLSLCGDWNHDDLTIAFGAPHSQSPHGEAAYYWKARVPLTAAQSEQRLPNRMQADDANADGRPQELGTYELWLSNYGGLDRGRTDDAGDDRHRYLQYAAYGLFMVFDNVKATPSFTRPQAFAAGYDAFGAGGMETTDLTTSIAATFKGHTMARELLNNGDANNIILRGAPPLRGEITLNACIGASACTGDGIPSGANRISGMISGLEALRHDGVWVPYFHADSIPMAEGEIAADGSFGGQLGHPVTAGGGENSWQFDADTRPGSTHASSYGGNFYGPREALEAAGWWHVQRDNRVRADYGSLIGSFGAIACPDGDSGC